MFLLLAGFAFGQSPLPLSAWTWVNQGSASVDTSNDTFYLTANAVANTHSVRMLVKTAPSPPFAAVATVGMLAAATNQWDAMTGIVWRESSTGRLVTCHIENNVNGGFEWYANAVYWTGPLSPVAVPALEQYRLAGNSDLATIRARDDGINRYCDVSLDGGAHWLNFYSEGRTVNMTADQIGFFGDNWEGSRTGAFASVLASWSGI